MFTILFLDPIAWVLFVIASCFKILALCLSIFLCVNAIIFIKYSIIGLPEPILIEDPQEDHSANNSKASNSSSSTKSDEAENAESIESERNGKIYGQKLANNFYFSLVLTMIDYLISCFVLSTGDGIIFGWTHHWCIFASPLFQLLWKYNTGSLLLWFCWVVMVHFVFAAAVHLFLHSIEWSASSPIEWVAGLIVGLYNYLVLSSAVESSDAYEHAKRLGIEGDMFLAVTDESTVIKAYKKKALKWHPDRAARSKTISKIQAQENFRECKKSRDALIDNYIHIRTRAISFITKTFPLILLVSVLDKYFIGFIWTDDSWYPLAWLFWTFISHSIVSLFIWWSIPLIIKHINRSGQWFGLVAIVICLFSVFDGVMGHGYLWKKQQDDDTSSSWFLYWEILWTCGMVCTHLLSYVLLLFFVPGNEWSDNQKLNEKYTEEQKSNPPETQEEEKKRESEHTSNLLYSLLTHRHSLLKITFITVISLMDYFWLNIGLFWNASKFSWPWNLIIGIIFLMFAFCRVAFLLLVLFHYAGTTGPIRKSTAMSVLPTVAMIMIVLTCYDSVNNGSGSDIGSSRDNDHISVSSGVGFQNGFSGLNIEKVTKSLFEEARVTFDEMMDDHLHQSGSGRGGALFGIIDEVADTNEDRKRSELNEGQYATKNDDEEHTNEDESGRRGGSGSGGGSSTTKVCTWSGWFLSQIVRVIVPAGYTIFGCRRKKIQSTNNDGSYNSNGLFIVMKSTIIRWTTISAGLSLWFGTIDSCFENSPQIDFALPFILLGVSRNGPEYFPWTITHNTGVKWMLGVLCLIYFPYNQLSDSGMIRMYVCMSIPCTMVLFGLLLQHVVSVTWLNSWFSREEYWGKFREIISGDVASDEFQNWFQKLLEEN